MGFSFLYSAKSDEIGKDYEEIKSLQDNPPPWDICRGDFTGITGSFYSWVVARSFAARVLNVWLKRSTPDSRWGLLLKSYHQQRIMTRVSIANGQHNSSKCIYWAPAHASAGQLELHGDILLAQCQPGCVDWMVLGFLWPGRAKLAFALGFGWWKVLPAIWTGNWCLIEVPQCCVSARGLARLLRPQILPQTLFFYPWPASYRFMFYWKIWKKAWSEWQWRKALVLQEH